MAPDPLERRLFALLLGALFVPIVVPSAVAEADAPGDADYSDPEGDALFSYWFPVDPPATAPNDLSGPADLTHVRITGEDEEGLTITIQVYRLPSVEESGRADYFLRFGLGGSQAEYELHIRFASDYYEGGKGKGYTLGFCANVDGRRCAYQRADLTVDPEHNALDVFLPKTSLMGLNSVSKQAREGQAPPAPSPNSTTPTTTAATTTVSTTTTLGTGSDPQEGDADQRPTPTGPPEPDAAPATVSLQLGSQLTEIRAEATYQSIFNQFRDRLPDDGSAGPYRMRAGAANQGILIELGAANATAKNPYGEHLEAAALPTATVVRGESTLVQLRVLNMLSSRRIVNLRAEVVDPADAPQWEFRIAPSLLLPSNESRIVNLVVNATPRVAHGDTGFVRITATSLSYAEKAILRVRLVGAVPPGPSSKDLFLHLRPEAARNDFADVGCTLQVLFACPVSAWMNTLPSDPRATADTTGTPLKGNDFPFDERSTDLRFMLDTRLPQDVVLDVTQNINLTVHVKPAAHFEGTLEVTLEGKSKTVATTQVGFSLDAEGDIVASLVPLNEAKRLPKDSTLELLLRFTEDVFTSPIGAAQPPVFVPTGSKLTLPIIPDPDRPISPGTKGPVFISLTSKSEPVEFVNPGKTKLFRVTVVNEGLAEDLVRITTRSTKPDWTTYVRPDDLYRLKPGESATIGAFIKAPKTAAENENVQFFVEATSGNLPSKVATLKRDVTATTSLVIPDESDSFVADSDTRAHAAGGGEATTPAFDVVAVVAAAAVIVGLLRRRVRKP